MGLRSEEGGEAHRYLRWIALPATNMSMVLPLVLQGWRMYLDEDLVLLPGSSFLIVVLLNFLLYSLRHLSFPRRMVHVTAVGLS